MSTTMDSEYIAWLTEQEFIWYGDTIVGELPPFAIGGPETLVILYTQGNDVSPHQPVPDFWQSIWDINCPSPFSVTRWYKEMSFGEQIINAYPRAHWTGTWHYCFLVDTITPPHRERWVWYRYCPKALVAADPEINFADYAVPGQVVNIVVLALAPGGGSGLCWPGGYGPFPTNDTFPNGDTVYVRFLWGLRGDAWAHTCHVGMNIHEYGHCCGWPDTYGDHYDMGSFCGHYGCGFARFHSWVDLIPSPLNPQWRYETKDRYTNQPWLIPTEITQTQLNYPIMPLRNTYNGEVLRIRPNQMPGISPGDTQTFLITNHQCLTPYEYNFPDSGLLIWHASRTTTTIGWSNTRRKRPIRLEYATGMYQWDSAFVNERWTYWPIYPDPIFGFDSLDMAKGHYGANGGVWPPLGSPYWRGFGSAGGFWDPPEYTRFDAFTNPSTNFYDIWHRPVYPEWIHSHFALRNLHPDPIDNKILRADILLNYVQSDVATTTSWNNARHIVSDATGNLYMVYEAGGYVYFTKTKVGTMIWEPAYPVGKGNSPAIALDNNNVPNIIWSHKDTLFWAKRQNYYTWPKYALYKPYQPGWEAYYCETPSFVIDNAGYGHIVFEKYIYANGPFSLILYARLDPLNPEQITWELIDSDYGLNRCLYPSIAVDGLTNPHIVWQKQGEIYYRYAQDGAWSEIRNISNSSDASYTPFIETSANWLHIVWVEEPLIPPDHLSNLRHIRCDLSTGLWYPPQWVTTTPVYSKLPQTLKGGHIVWTEYEIPDGNMEIYHSVWNYETGSWGVPENISNTLNSSNAPQVAIVSGPPLPRRYLVTIWCEDDGVLYEVRKDKRPLPEPNIYSYIELGGEVPSVYTIERDGYFAYGPEDYKTVDYDSTKLIYRVTGFEDGYRYRIKFVLYHEGGSRWKLKIRIDNGWTRNIWVEPYQLTVVEGMIPEAFIKDGEIVITDEVTQGELAVLSSIIIYQESEGQGGPQEQEVVNIGNKVEPLVIKPNPVKDNAEIYYQIGSPGIMHLSLYDITGRRVKSFINGYFEQGYYKLVWDGTDDSGRRLSEGVYFIRLDNQAGSLTQKVIIIR